MKKKLVILLVVLSLNIIFGMSNKWNLITNSNHPLVKFKFAKSFIEERIPPNNRRRGAFVGATNRQKYLDSDGYYRFSVRGIVFTNQEGNILQDISIADADKLENPIYRFFNKKYAVIRNLTSVNQLKEFFTAKGFEEGITKTVDVMGKDLFFQEGKKIKYLKVGLAFKYKNAIHILFTLKGMFPNDREMIIGSGAYLVQDNNNKWVEKMVHLGHGDMINNIRGFIEMVKGDMSKITTTVDDGYDYPLVKF